MKLQSLHKKMKFSIKNFFSKCEQIRRNLRIWSHLWKKSLMENFIFCAVSGSQVLLKINFETVSIICYLNFLMVFLMLGIDTALLDKPPIIRCPVNFRKFDKFLPWETGDFFSYLRKSHSVSTQAIFLKN